MQFENEELSIVCDEYETNVLVDEHWMSTYLITMVTDEYLISFKAAFEGTPGEKAAMHFVLSFLLECVQYPMQVLSNYLPEDISGMLTYLALFQHFVGIVGLCGGKNISEIRNGLPEWDLESGTFLIEQIEIEEH